MSKWRIGAKVQYLHDKKWTGVVVKGKNENDTEYTYVEWMDGTKGPVPSHCLVPQKGPEAQA